MNYEYLKSKCFEYKFASCILVSSSLYFLYKKRTINDDIKLIQNRLNILEHNHIILEKYLYLSKGNCFENRITDLNEGSKKKLDNLWTSIVQNDSFDEDAEKIDEEDTNEEETDTDTTDEDVTDAVITDEEDIDIIDATDTDTTDIIDEEETDEEETDIIDAIDTDVTDVIDTDVTNVIDTDVTDTDVTDTDVPVKEKELKMETDTLNNILSILDKTNKNDKKHELLKLSMKNNTINITDVELYDNSSSDKFKDKIEIDNNHFLETPSPSKPSPSKKKFFLINNII